MLESTRAGLDHELFPPKRNVVLTGRDVADLGPADVVAVFHDAGAVRLCLASREHPGDRLHTATVEVLPRSAEDFLHQAAHLLGVLTPDRRAPVPETKNADTRSFAPFGEAAAFQVQIIAQDLEMIWCSVASPHAVRCVITSGQLKALAESISKTLAGMTDEDKRLRLVDMTDWGSAKRLRKEDGDAPVGAIINLTPPKLPED
jgi:hypothetical protein